jgi:phage repressor protein C with HTH and peptisase S24 domain/DNA-binding XRE family transcriptional regulator
MTTGEKMRLIRETIGLNQTQLANTIGFAPSFISGIERGAKDPSRELLQKLLDTYGVDLNWFLSESWSGEAFIFPERFRKKGDNRPRKLPLVHISGTIVPPENGECLDQSDLVPRSGSVYMNANGREIVSDEYVALALLDQRVSAGPGQELIDYDSAARMVPVLKKMLRGLDPVGAFGAEVDGDSMTGEKIFDGDIVVFYRGLVKENGLYVLFRDGRLFVKRLTFSFTTSRIKISSANERYPDVEEVEDSQAIMIAGKVLGWVHVHPY